VTPPIEAVIFDWGGTLSVFVEVDLADMWRLTAARLDPARVDVVCERLAAIEVATFDRVATDQVASTLADILRTASSEFGIDVAEAVLEEAATHYLDSWTPHIVHEPDAGPVLRGLKDRGLKTALLSNTHWPRAFHEHFLERDGLADLLDARLYTSEMSHMKPHPSVFAAALDAIGVVDPAAAVFVGDRKFDDIAGASSAGLRTVWRRNETVPGHDVTADAEIGALGELPALIDRWSAGD